MATGTGVVIAKAAATALTNPKLRKGIMWIIAAVLSPLIALVAIIFGVFVATQNSTSVIDLVFNEAPIGNIPQEQRLQIEYMRENFAEIDNINMSESLDKLKIKAYFYVLFQEQSEVDISDFVNCFTAENTDTVHKNISSLTEKTLSESEIERINSLYDYLTQSPENVSYIPIEGFVSPVDGWEISVSSEYGMRYHPKSGEYSMHYGIDLSKPQGTSIYSVMDGVITTADYDGGYGNFIVINHGGAFETLYAHCHELLVTHGQEVIAGEVIATVGTTGVSTGNHLHFEIIVNGEKVNPRTFLPR